MDKQQILQSLSHVFDPNTGQDIVNAGLVKDLDIRGNAVFISLELASNNSEYKADLNLACTAAVQDSYPEAEVNLHFVMRSPEAGKTTSILPQVKNIIAVASGKGGVGKSTVATNLALGLKQLGARVGLLDADLYGPSVPTMVGLQGKRPQVQDVYGQPKLVPLEAYGMPVMSLGFIIEPEQAVVLRGPRLAGIIKQFFNDTLWPQLDYLVVDLPPGTGDIQLTLVQTVPVTGAIMVTTPQEVAVIDAVKAMNMFLLPQVNVPILGVVENMAWFTPAELPNNKYFIFGQGGGTKLSTLSRSRLLGQIPIVLSVREGGDSGKPAVLKGDDTVSKAFLELAGHVAEQVKIRNEQLAPTQVIRVEQ